MSKYIIELDDRIKLVTSVGVTENGVVYTTSDYVRNLEELNSDYINEHYGELQDEAYQAGLNDAWEVAQKIMNMPDPPYWDVFCEYKNELFKKLSASEAIAKLKAYEHKDSDSIEVGDEVTVASLTDGPLTVVGKDKVLDKNGNPAMCYSLLSAKTGTVFEHDVKDHSMDEWETPFKTGRHFDHIDKLLEAMRT